MFDEILEKLRVFYETQPAAFWVIACLAIVVIALLLILWVVVDFNSTTATEVEETETQEDVVFYKKVASMFESLAKESEAKFNSADTPLDEKRKILKWFTDVYPDVDGYSA